MTSPARSPRILIAGASGYIGRALLPRLLERFPAAEVTALSRRARPSDDPRVRWIACDLFSLKSVQHVVSAPFDLVIYLVHSMSPTALVDQGSFADYDVIMADNLARVLKIRGVRHVIYIGGLIPTGEEMSLHLRSRLEVEEIFRQYRLPLTTFRAGLIMGEDGSSFQILLKLVRRLPVMLCPGWTQTLTTPVTLPAVLDAITNASLDEAHVRKVYDLAGCRPLSYVSMMRELARQLGRRRYFFTVPFMTAHLSRLWLRLITNSPRALVYPLIDSLRHPMVARPDHRFPGVEADRAYADLLREVPARVRPRGAIYHRPPRPETVRSVQRLPLPAGRDAEWIKQRYLAWLPRAFFPFLRVRVSGDDITFSILFNRPVLLKLRFSPERSTPDRQLLYIQAGGLANPSKSGRLEFRTILNRRFVIAAIHDFKPRLPWLIYKNTQAVLHLIVMKAFGRLLGRETSP